MLRRIWAVLLLLVSVGVSSALAQETPADRERRILQEAVAQPSDQTKIEAFVNSLVEIPRGSGHYIVEGDIVLAREEIESYLRSFKTAKPLQSGELIVNVVGGQSDYLKEPARRHLTYALSTDTFPTAEAAAFTRGNFQKAANDWVTACPECGVSFTEVNPGNAYFEIVYQDATGGTIARSFFPSSAASQRQLVVFTPYLSPTLEFDPAGVLRHEIGHILGYRHEHIQNIPGCYTEDNNWRPITPYTPNSVMHYFCGGKGSFDLALRDADKRGHRCLYTTGQACPDIKE